MSIRVSREGRRGCGYRSPGGLYMMGGGSPVPCGQLPLELHRCPCCGGGIKQGRGFEWIQPDGLFDLKPCVPPGVPTIVQGRQHSCYACPLNGQMIERDEKHGLMWVGVQHYRSPEDFMREAYAMGISKRIPGLPRGVKLWNGAAWVGDPEDEESEAYKLWVFLAHPRGMVCPVCASSGKMEEADPAGENCEHCDGKGRVPAIFTVFRPTSFEKVVEPDISDEEVEKLLERGIEPVVVEKLEEQQELGDAAG